nr:hypothetical protein [Tanacetum cinerariifolium]
MATEVPQTLEYKGGQLNFVVENFINWKKKVHVPHEYEWDEEEMSSDDNEMVKVKVLMALVEDNDTFSKKGVDQLTKDPSSSREKGLVFVKSSANDTKVSMPCVERPWLSEDEGFILPNHDTSMILPPESQTNTTKPPVAVTDSSATSADESSVCSTLIPLLEKLGGAEPASGTKAIKSILNSNSTFKMKALKIVSINEPSSVPAKINKMLQLQKLIQLPLKN